MKKSLRVGVSVVGIAAVPYVGLSVGAAMNGRAVMDLYDALCGEIESALKEDLDR